MSAKLTMTQQKKIRAATAFQIFLTSYCDEGTNLMVSGVDLRLGYLRAQQCGLITNSVFLYDHQIYTLAVFAGFEKITKSNVDDKSIKRNQNKVYFRGVDVLWSKLSEASGYPENKLRDNTLIGPWDFEKKLALVPTPIRDQVTENHQEESTPENTSKPSHIEINGTVYSREMIATIKAIKPFRKTGKTEFCSHIVTFYNAELRHQFITQDTADKVIQILT